MTGARQGGGDFVVVSDGFAKRSCFLFALGAAHEPPLNAEEIFDFTHRALGVREQRLIGERDLLVAAEDFIHPFDSRFDFAELVQKVGDRKRALWGVDDGSVAGAKSPPIRFSCHFPTQHEAEEIAAREVNDSKIEVIAQTIPDAGVFLVIVPTVKIENLETDGGLVLGRRSK